MTIDDFKNGQCSSSDVASLSTAELGTLLGDILNELKNNSRNKESDVYKNLKHNKDVLTEQLIGRLNGVNDLDIKTKGILLESIESGSGLQNVNLQQIKELLIEQLISSQLTINDVNNWSIRMKGTLLESIESESGSQNVNLQENKKLLIEQLVKEKLTDKDVSRWSEQTIEDLLSSIKNELIRTPQNGNLEDNKKVLNNELEIRKEVRNLENTITVTQNSDNIQINLEKAAISLKNLAELTGTYKKMINAECDKTLDGRRGQTVQLSGYVKKGIKGVQDSQGQTIKGLIGDGKGIYDILAQLAVINKIVKERRENFGGRNTEKEKLYNIKNIYIKKIIDLLCSDEKFENIPVAFIQTEINNPEGEEGEVFSYAMAIDVEEFVYTIDVHGSYRDMIEYAKRKDEEYAQKHDGNHRFVRSDENGAIVGRDKGSLHIINGIENVHIREGFYSFHPGYTKERFFSSLFPIARANFRTEDLLTMGIDRDIITTLNLKVLQGASTSQNGSTNQNPHLIPRSTSYYFYQNGLTLGEQYYDFLSDLVNNNPNIGIDKEEALLSLIPQECIERIKRRKKNNN